MLSSASCNVTVTFGLAALSKPRWLSLICTKVNSLLAASALSIGRERGTPPATVQTKAVPAQVMHFRKPRRSIFGSTLIYRLPLVRGPLSGSAVDSTGIRGRLFPELLGIIMPACRVLDAAASSQDKGLAPRRPPTALRALALLHLDAAYNPARWLA